ncbi:MAG: type II toxin-antitoxin system VapC family toxin [Caldilineaceae bacterium]|nr:type II toxin-antitoxin system VapC family toxin [Caldilineaceae bacterium]
MTSDSSADCVVDASVGIKLFLVESLSDETHALFRRLTDDPPARFYIPDLFYVECTNILWKYVRRLGLPQADAALFAVQLGQLALVPSPTAALIDDALKIALMHAITAYDAAYVALAGQLDLPLITADARLARALAESDHDVRWLGDLPEPVAE